jgi:NDP-sugar pyrophosphorylase family protein
VASYIRYIDSFILSCSDKKEEIRKHMIDFFIKEGAVITDRSAVKDLFYCDTPILWGTEPRPFGTLMGVLSALPNLRTPYVLVMNGDTFCPVEIDKLLQLSPNYDITVIEHEGINTGVWLVKTELLKATWEYLSLHRELLSRNLTREWLLGEEAAGLGITYRKVQGPAFIDMGTVEGIEQAKRELKR